MESQGQDNVDLQHTTVVPSLYIASSVACEVHIYHCVAIRCHVIVTHCLLHVWGEESLSNLLFTDNNIGMGNMFVCQLLYGIHACNGEHSNGHSQSSKARTG